MKTITLTDEQHLLLKAVLDRALEATPDRLPLQALWHACARATSGTAEVLPPPLVFVWEGAGGSWTIGAKDEDEAMRVAVANRMAAGQTAEEAIRWLRKADSITEIDGAVTDAPYQGEMPDDLHPL